MLLEYSFKTPKLEDVPVGVYGLDYETEILNKVYEELYLICLGKGIRITRDYCKAYTFLSYYQQKHNEYVLIQINRDSESLEKMVNEFPKEFSDVALAMAIEI